MHDYSIELRPLRSAPRAVVIAQMNDARVRRHLPLASGTFDDAAYEGFIEGKEALWDDHGYGPWAIFLDDQYAGWGGLQPDDSEAELALVLCPWAFGQGANIAKHIIAWGFERRDFDQILVYLPLSRDCDSFLKRNGFSPDGCITIGDVVFTRYYIPHPKRVEKNNDHG